MPQEILSFASISPLQENWDAALQAAVFSLANALKSFLMSIYVQGSHTAPSHVRIQICDANGEPMTRVFQLRVRVTDNASYAPATNATISAWIGTLVETKTANKDLIIESDSTGLIDVLCTDTTAETFNVLIGPPPVNAEFANYNNALAVTHA